MKQLALPSASLRRPWVRLRCGRWCRGRRVERAYTFWAGGGNGHAVVLRAGEAQHVVHSRLCGGLRAGRRLWISSGRMALRAGGIGVVPGSVQAMVEGAIVKFRSKPAQILRL